MNAIIKIHYFGELLLAFVLVLSIITPVSSAPVIKAVRRPNVILIVVDTLRADHLGCYGYGRNTSPNIDRLASHATLFAPAVTVYPRTIPSAASLFTGLYPHTHGIRSMYEENIPAEFTLLSELLKKAGYQTAAFVNHGAVARMIARGFDVCRFCELDKIVSDGALSWLEGARLKDHPFFLLLWYLSPHWTYYPNNEEREIFELNGDEPNLQRLIARGENNPTRSFFNIYSDRELEFLLRAYDGEIHFSDRHMGRVLDYLKEQGLHDNSLIVVTSDHGESLGEHDYFFEHGEYYYDSTALVPLIIKRAGQKERKKIEMNFRTIDIFPTILGETGIDHSCEGEDIFRYLEEGPGNLVPLMAFGENDLNTLPGNPRRYIRGIAGKWRIVRTQQWKLIYIPHPEKDIFEFYDLQNDPSEEKNLIMIPTHQEKINKFKEELFKWIKKEDYRAVTEPSADRLSPAQKETLKSLGYIN